MQLQKSVMVFQLFCYIEPEKPASITLNKYGWTTSVKKNNSNRFFSDFGKVTLETGPVNRGDNQADPSSPF